MVCAACTSLDEKTISCRLCSCLCPGCLSHCCTWLSPTGLLGWRGVEEDGIADPVDELVEVVFVLSLLGSPWWRAQLCHGTLQLHLHSRTNRLLLHDLHHVLWLRLAMVKTSLVPSTAKWHTGQLNMMMFGGGLACKRLCSSGLFFPAPEVRKEGDTR